MGKYYETAREIYGQWGVDTEEALRRDGHDPPVHQLLALDDLTGLRI